MKVFDSFFRHREHELARVVLVIDAVDDDIVDVEQQVAVCFLQYGIGKFDFRHGRIGRRVIGDVLHGHTLLKNVLRLPDSTGDVADCFLRKRDRHKVVKLAVVTAITQVLGIKTDVVFGHESLDVVQQLFIER